MEYTDLMSGTDRAKARDKWLLSDAGMRCCDGVASGQYLENRLKSAFSAGINAALAHVWKRPAPASPQPPAKR